jgi:hypothetical protein
VQVVVMTHHAPTFEKTSSPKFERTAMSSIYATDLTSMFGKPIVAWLFGHTVRSPLAVPRLITCRP